ncbi:MAG: hypothetical protein U5N86_00015 [Planctomycetota bacterium]|nr:hypothetical protein [Planctomycetota bacterium]
MLAVEKVGESSRVALALWTGKLDVQRGLQLTRLLEAFREGRMQLFAYVNGRCGPVGILRGEDFFKGVFVLFTKREGRAPRNRAISTAARTAMWRMVSPE